MGINVSTSMGFENRDFLRDRAKQILQKDGAEKDKADKLAKSLNLYSSGKKNIGLDILTSSTQITMSNSLKETLKYLNSHANDKRKQYVLGELWEKLGNYDDENSKAELLDFEIDYNLTNIFAA